MIADSGDSSCTPAGAASKERPTCVSPERYSMSMTPSRSTTTGRTSTASALAAVPPSNKKNEYRFQMKQRTETHVVNSLQEKCCLQAVADLKTRSTFGQSTPWVECDIVFPSLSETGSLVLRELAMPHRLPERYKIGPTDSASDTPLPVLIRSRPA